MELFIEIGDFYIILYYIILYYIILYYISIKLMHFKLPSTQFITSALFVTLYFLFMCY